jgi:hypothetical protein
LLCVDKYCFIIYNINRYSWLINPHQKWEVEQKEKTMGKKKEQFNDSGFDACLKGITNQRRVSVSVGELGFPNGADLIQINHVLKSHGFENFPDKILLNAAKESRRVYAPAMSFSLRRL